MILWLYNYMYVYTVDIYFSDPLSWLLFSSKPLGRIGDFGRRSGEGEPTGKEQGHQNLWTQWPNCIQHHHPKSKSSCENLWTFGINSYLSAPILLPIAYLMLSTFGDVEAWFMMTAQLSEWPVVGEVGDDALMSAPAVAVAIFCLPEGNWWHTGYE